MKSRFRLSPALPTLLFSMSLALGLPTAAQDEAEEEGEKPAQEAAKKNVKYRTFRSKSGKELEARVLNRIDDERYEVETPDGKTFTLNTNTLSERDAFYLDAWEPGGEIDFATANLAEVLEKLEYSRVSLSTSGENLVAPVKVNGQAYKFVIAPGRNFSSLNPDAATALGLELSPGPLNINKPGGQSERANQGTAETFRVGEVELSSATFIVYNVASFVRGADKADGMLGGELIKKLNAVIDYGEKQLFVRASE